MNLLYIFFIFQHHAFSNANYATRALGEYKTLCPLTEICAISTTSSPTTSTTTKRPTAASDGVPQNLTLVGSFESENAIPEDFICCKQCSCDAGCGNNCCPNVREEFLNETEVDAQRQWQCVYAQGEKSENGYIYNDHAFMMRGFCPMSYPRNEIFDNCFSKYEDYLFENGPEYFGPVFSRSANASYRNRYCAECFGEDERNIVNWSVNVACEKGPVIIGSFKDIPGTFLLRCKVIKLLLWF